MLLHPFIFIGTDMTNPVIETLLNRKSVRAFEERPIEPEIRAEILNATLRAPTAGNMMLYSIIDITEQSVKDQLAHSCDDQPFIARAPMVWIFVADYQRWYDQFLLYGAADYAAKRGIEVRKPGEGDMLLACTDTVIAAQQSVIAAESFGLSSCYIGDIIENYEFHQRLLDLPRYAVPIAMLVYGYPTEQQKNRIRTTRFDAKYVVHYNQYRRLPAVELEAMMDGKDDLVPAPQKARGVDNFALWMYAKKFDSVFSKEMTRSSREIIKNWQQPDQ